MSRKNRDVSDPQYQKICPTCILKGKIITVIWVSCKQPLYVIAIPLYSLYIVIIIEPKLLEQWEDKKWAYLWCRGGVGGGERGLNPHVPQWLSNRSVILKLVSFRNPLQSQNYWGSQTAFFYCTKFLVFNLLSFPCIYH